MKARDVMVSPVITVGENETVRDVAKLLIANRISAVPVIDSTGKLIGIVTEADLLHRTEAGTDIRKVNEPGCAETTLPSASVSPSVTRSTPCNLSPLIWNSPLAPRRAPTGKRRDI